MRRRRLLRAERGQVLTEYALMAVLTLFVALALLALLAFFSEYGWRIISLLAFEPGS